MVFMSGEIVRLFSYLYFHFRFIHAAMSLPYESACTGQTIDTWKYDLVKRHFGVKEEDGGGNIVDVVTGGGGEMAEEKVEKERGFKIVDVEEDDSKENNEAINDVKANDDADDESGGGVDWTGTT